MQQYLDLLKHVKEEGVEKSDRTGTGTRSVFGYQMRFNLEQGFPLMTTKKMHTRSIIHELLWFLKGDTNVKYLQDNNVTIWDEWADAEGNLGPVYGKQWRSWETPTGETIDQISEVVNQIRTNPDSRRLVVSAWNVADLPKMRLAPCHCLFQFYTTNMTNKERLKYINRGASVDTEIMISGEEADITKFFDNANVPSRKLSCQLYQRSADIFLGVPFNIASYALFTQMVAQVTNMVPGEFVHTLGDAHIYKNHFQQIDLQLSRKPFPLSRMKLNPAKKDIFDFKFEDFTLENYVSHPAIKAPISV